MSSSSAVKRIQYASGLARALKDGAAAADLLQPVAPYLALCGNIVHPRDAAAGHFFRWAARNYETVWWVPGHEEVHAAGKKPGGRFEYGLTDNLSAMYELVQAEGLKNVHIGNKLSRDYSGFHVLGISMPNFNDRNAEGIYYNTGKPFKYADLEYYRLKDQQWLERELYSQQTLAKAYGKPQPVVIMTDGYFITQQPYSVSILGDSKVNMSGFNHGRLKNAWFGVNNAEAAGYQSDKFVELM
jgi:hypothetical protein